MSLITPLGEYVAPFIPVANITPFTYRDGLSFVDILEDLRCYVNETLVEFVNTNFGKLGDDFETQVNLLFAQVEAQLTNQDAAVAGQVDALTQYVNDQVQGIIGSSVVVTDPMIKGLVGSPSQTQTAMDHRYKIGHDVRDYGAKGDGVFDNTTAIQNCVNDAGVSGLVVFPEGLFQVSAPILLLANTEIRGAGAKATSIQNINDTPIFKIVGGEGQSISNLKLNNLILNRTTYDIDVTNPTKTVFRDVEIILSNDSNGGGGIYFRHDDLIPGNPFMPQLDRVWLRNAFLVSDGVTDGKVNDCFFWGVQGGGGGQPGTVTLKNASNGWTFTGVDIAAVPPDGAAYYINSTLHTTIIGGYCDGGPYGIHTVSSAWTIVTGTWMHHMLRSGLWIENSHGGIFTGIMFDRCNQANNFYPDILVTSSTYNIFNNTIHSQAVNNSNPGVIFNAEPTSTGNSFDNATIDLAAGNYYPAPVMIAPPKTQGKNNRPGTLWPHPASVPTFIVPPASLMAGGTPETVWPVANRAQFHRFFLADGGVYRLANILVKVASGNVQAAIVKMDGLNYTRMAASPITVAVNGPMALNFGSIFLDPGEYAIALWADNTTLQIEVSNNELIRASRMTNEISSLPSGIPASGTFASWSSARAVNGMTITQ